MPPPAALGGTGVAPADHLGGPAHGLRPVAVGGRVEGDERVARGAARFAQPELDAGRCRARRAASSMFDSTAQFCCGLPKPRKAVDGTVCDSTLRATIRAAGQSYGPSDV